MTHSNLETIDGGSARYWQKRREAFRLIHEAERAAERLENAPLDVAGRWDEEFGDYEPVENLAPFDAMADAICAIEANRTAISILAAQRRTEIRGYQIAAVSRRLRGFDEADAS